MKKVLAAIQKYEGRDDQDLLWQYKVKMYLSTKDLDSYIESPIETAATTQQKLADNKAKSIICTCLSDTLLCSVINEQSAYSTWIKIEDTFSKKSRATRTRIIKEFWNLQKGDQSIATYFSIVQALAQQLKSAGKTLNDNDLIDKILSGLPEEYDPIIIRMENKPPLQEVISSLINHKAQLSYRKREDDYSSGSTKHQADPLQVSSLLTAAIVSKQ